MNSLFAPVLKMIANLLPEDENHIVGGSVLVNGVDSRNKEIVWRVRMCNHGCCYCPHIGLLSRLLTNIMMRVISSNAISYRYWQKNVVSYVDQIDMLHGFLTVKETIEFAFQCSYGYVICLYICSCFDIDNAPLTY